MERYFDYREIQQTSPTQRVVTIGNFDGVHLGHRAVLRRARKEADALGLDLAVLTFEPHPAELLKPAGPRLRLVEPGRKLALLEENGVDQVLAQRFDEQFAHIDPQQFATEVLSESLGAKLVIVGQNFRFGKARAGNIDTLCREGQRLGFTVRAEHLVRGAGQEISSSRIRGLLADGKVDSARDLLGRYHEVPGLVAPDRGKGTSLGFPTVNLTQIPVVIPKPGIYAARCRLADGDWPAAVYIGDRPTLGHGFAVEAHLLDFARDLYDSRVVLRFVDRIRGDQKFDSKESLVAQMTRDVEKIRRLLTGTVTTAEPGNPL